MDQRMESDSVIQMKFVAINYKQSVIMYHCLLRQLEEAGTSLWIPISHIPLIKKKINIRHSRETEVVGTWYCAEGYSLIYSEDGRVTIVQSRFVISHCAAQQSRERAVNWTLRKEPLVNQRCCDSRMEKLITIVLCWEQPSPSTIQITWAHAFF